MKLSCRKKENQDIGKRINDLNILTEFFYKVIKDAVEENCENWLDFVVLDHRIGSFPYAMMFALKMEETDFLQELVNKFGYNRLFFQQKTSGGETAHALLLRTGSYEEKALFNTIIATDREGKNVLNGSYYIIEVF